MRFRARLAQVNGTSPRSADSPNVVTVKLEPVVLLEPDWLFARLGREVWVELEEAGPERLTLEDAIAQTMRG